jgi:hypothetical protein
MMWGTQWRMEGRGPPKNSGGLVSGLLLHRVLSSRVPMWVRSSCGKSAVQVRFESPNALILAGTPRVGRRALATQQRDAAAVGQTIPFRHRVEFSTLVSLTLLRGGHG